MNETYTPEPTIAICVQSDQYEEIVIHLSSTQVKELYAKNKSLNDQIEKLTKEVAQQTSYKEMYSKTAEERYKEITETHQILTALGVDKEVAGTYSPEQLSLAARIALLIVKLKG